MPHTVQFVWPSAFLVKCTDPKKIVCEHFKYSSQMSVIRSLVHTHVRHNLSVGLVNPSFLLHLDAHKIYSHRLIIVVPQGEVGDAIDHQPLLLVHDRG